MEIPPNILKELEEKKAQAVLSGAVAAPEKQEIGLISPIGPISPIGLIEAEPHKPSGGEIFFGYLTKVSVFLAVLLTPLFFFTASDTFGLPKQLLLSVLAAAAAASWVAQTIAAGKIVWRKNILMWPIALVAVAGLLSSVFSSSFWVSFLGDSGRYSSAGVSILSYLILAVIGFQILKKNKDISIAVGLWLGSVFLVSVFSLLQFFGIHILSGEIFKNRIFNPVGSQLALALFVLSSAPFILVHLSKVKPWNLKGMALILMLAAQLAVAVIVDFGTAWIALAASAVVLILMGFKGKEGEEMGSVKLMGPIGLIIIAALFYFMAAPQIKGLVFPAEINPSYRASLQIMTQALKEKPVFGFGLETYPYAYSKFKSPALNQTNYWGVNFNDSVSEVVTWATTTGIFGTLAWLIFAFMVLIIGVGIASNATGQGLLASWVFILVSKFLYPTSLPLEFLFWFIPALLVLKGGEWGGRGETGWSYRFQTGSVKTLAIFFVLLVVMLGSLGGLYFSVKRWGAEKTFVRSVTASNTATAEDSVGKRDEVLNGIYEAIAADPYEPRYFRVLAQALFAKMGDVVAGINSRPANERQAKPEESAMLQNLTVRTINAVQRATALDPRNVGVAVDAAESYRELAPMVQGSDDLAIQNYERAADLEPINPFIKTQLGQLYLIKSNAFNYGLELDEDYLAKARGVLEKALELNPNYANARYFHALIQDKDGDKDGALRNFLILRQTNPDNKLIAAIVTNLQNGFPALGLPPQPATPPQSPKSAGTKGIPKK